jgi:hypothetical protein
MNHYAVIVSTGIVPTENPDNSPLPSLLKYRASCVILKLNHVAVSSLRHYFQDPGGKSDLTSVEVTRHELKEKANESY